MTTTKSLAQIHQQTLDIFCRLDARKHTLTTTIDKLTQIHNHYAENIAAYFGIISAAYLTVPQWNRPFPRNIYACGKMPAHRHASIPMTPADLERIRVAQRLHYSQWHIIADMEDMADTEEARLILHDLRRDKSVKEKNLSDYHRY